jgi:hypothetical protein
MNAVKPNMRQVHPERESNGTSKSASGESREREDLKVGEEGV